MTNPYRIMCAELVRLWDAASCDHDLLYVAVAMDRARALLAQAVADGPTDEDLDSSPSPACLVITPSPEALASLKAAGPGIIKALPAERTVLVPVAQPVAVSERLPGPEDCEARGWCWVFYRGFATWTLEPPLGQDGKHTGYTHWLPANALPTPTQ